MFLSLLTNYNGPEYPRPEAASQALLGRKAEAAVIPGSRPADREAADELSQSLLTRREKQAIRVQVQEHGRTREYSLPHVERLVRQGKAHVAEDGTVIRGLIPDVDTAERFFAHQHQVRQGFGPPVRDDLPAPPSLTRADELWTVIPHYFGESITEGLKRLDRERNQNR